MLSIERLLYKLKRRFGKPIDFYTESDSTNLLTGIITKSIQKYSISQGIILKEKNSLFDTILAETNKIIGKTNPIIEGSGLLNIVDTQILIDGKDFPKGLILKNIDYVIIDHERYEIKNIIKIDDNQSYHLILREYKGSKLYEIHSQCIHHKLTMVHKVKYV